MADSDLKINVVTTADTSGIKEVADEMRNFEDVAKRTGETVSQVQARFAEGPKLVQAITTEAQKTTKAFELTRAEATSLAGELIRGDISARSLGTSLSGFGNSFAIAGVAALVVFKAIDDIAAAILKSTEEAAKFETTLRKDVEQWAEMARYATSLGDVVNLSSAVKKDLDKMADDMEKFRQTQLGFWQKFWDAIRPGGGFFNLPTFGGAKADEAAKKQEELNRAVHAGNTEIDEAERKFGEHAQAVAHLGEGIRDYGQKVSDLAVTLKELDAEAAADPTNKSILERRRQVLKDLQETDKVYHELVADQERLNDATKGGALQLKDYETILQNIRQQQQVTQSQAFIGVDQKNLQLLQQYRQEVVQVINAMRELSTKKLTLTDPAEIARANQELQKLQANYQKLAVQITTMTHQFQAGLQNWANSFGSLGTQLANTLQQTVGAALQSFNTWIVTGKFNLQSLIQQIEMLGLQLVEQLIIQRVVAMINARVAEAQAVASSKIIAAAWASAATAVTIATEGEAAYAAPGAVAIALGGVQAALGLGTLHEGGPVQRRMHSGGLAHDEVPIIAQEGEIMIRRDVAQAPGMADYLLGLNAGMYHAGGFVAGRRYHFGSGDYGGDGFDPFWKNPNLFNMPSGGGSPFFNPPDLPPVGAGPADLTQPPFTVPPNYSDNLGRALDWGGFNFSQAGLASFNQAGFFGPAGTGWFNQGPTMIATTLGQSGFPMAVPLIAPDYMPSTGVGGLPGKKVSHSGGLITRMHSGGGVSGGRGGGGVHIYAFTDLKQLTKHMSSREGQKIIFDTVKGRRIDLGI